MGREIWLRSNRRAMAAGLVIPILLTVIALSLLVLGSGSLGTLILGTLLLLPALLGFAAWWTLDRTPRMAYQDDCLLITLAIWQTHRIPIDKVECFFAGRAPALLPASAGEGHETRVWSVVVRLAESAKEWHDRSVTAAWGEWKDGYITIRGTWCEPIDPPLLQQLNHRLAEAHRRRRQREATQ
jgi:hypothetical protein